MANSRWYANKSFWGALCVAIALWIYASMNDEYQTVIDVPLSVSHPAGRAIEDALPNQIAVDVVGNGWYLFNYLYLNKLKRCNVNLNEVSKIDSIYTITNADLQKGLENTNKIRARRFYPDVFKVKTGEIASKEIPIKSAVKINLKDGFVLVGKVTTSPQIVIITGNKRLIDSITSWETSDVELNDVNASFAQYVSVSDSLASIISVKPSNIMIEASVQQYGEITFDDIELQVLNGNLTAENILAPRLFSVTLTGGIEFLSKMSAADIILSIDYETILNDSTGVLVPKIKIPAYTKVLNISPQFIHHKRINKYTKK